MTNTTINQSTLMIGNYVTNEFEEIILVKSLDHRGINLELETDHRPEFDHHWIEPSYRYDELLPILLTECTLSKIQGLRKNPSVKNQYKINELILIYRNHDWIEYVTEQPINTLHELQNFYFWRYKTPLTINIDHQK